MNYYILTQGVQSSDYNFICKNGAIVNTDNNSQRRDILERINRIENKGFLLTNREAGIKIYKRKRNFVLVLKSTNTDRLNRTVPIYLLFENYTRSADLNLNDILTLLKDENIKVDNDIFINLQSTLSNKISEFNIKKNIIVITSSVIIGTGIILIAKYLLKWI